MYTQNYSDLIRSSQLLQELLDSNKTKLSLSTCQEIIAKLYRFDSMYDAEQRLSRPIIQITKPIYLLRQADIHKWMRYNKYTPEDMWPERTIGLIDSVIESCALDINNIDAEKLVSLAKFKNLEKLDNAMHPRIQKYFDILPGYRLSMKGKSAELHSYMIMQIEYLLLPYIHKIDKDILLYHPPGSPKTLWLMAMITNWIYSHPGKPVIILDSQKELTDYIKYLQFNEPHLKIHSTSASYFDNEINLSQLLTTQIESTDIIHIKLEESPGLSGIIEKWFQTLTNLTVNEEILIVLDNLHRAPNIVSLTKHPQTLGTYIYTSQNNNIDAQYELSNIEVHMTAPAMNYLWLQKGNAQTAEFKEHVIMKYGYERAYSLLNMVYPYGISAELEHMTPFNYKDLLMQTIDAFTEAPEETKS